eukprot:TRINITY_DN21686_c0_g1_i1.p1 TRINITY_DN21686_c0_g1~~TRINITY_DN21686_c0_g1_i1.p1  ORF type:complete len:171 (-),score=33.22 TRINITY_DN21686_c0_g1_i1:37-549(-)
MTGDPPNPSLLAMAVLYLSLHLTGSCNNLRMRFDFAKIVEPKICTGLPRIEGEMKNRTVEEGKQVSFTCLVDHSCLVNSIKWFHTPLDNTSTTLIKTARSIGHPHIHIIKSANISNSGLYSCVVENVMGSTKVVAFLGVSGCGVGLEVKKILVIALITLFVINDRSGLIL